MWGFLRNRKKERIQELIEKEAVLLDVRSASEYNSGHIDNSINIPVQSLDHKLNHLDKEKPIVVYCAMGGRSAIAAARLRQAGYKVTDAKSIKKVKKIIASST
jgi:phage shock protein E